MPTPRTNRGRAAELAATGRVPTKITYMHSTGPVSVKVWCQHDEEYRKLLEAVNRKTWTGFKGMFFAMSKAVTPLLVTRYIVDPS